MTCLPPTIVAPELQHSSIEFLASTNKLIFMNLELWYTNELIGRNLRILWFE